MERRFLEQCLARGMSLEAIGEEVGRHPSTVSYRLKKYGLVANGAEKHARRGAICRDRLTTSRQAGPHWRRWPSN
jgi:IS30 family transposase